jgi:hypothetical protein
VRPDRDRILEQALKHELRAALPRADGAPTPACLDAETIAAWQDGGLDAAHSDAAELHASTCPHCQAMLAAFARSTPGTLGTPGTEGTAGTFRWWRFWLAPVAAAAAAVTLWMVVPGEQQRLTSVAAPAAESKTTVAVEATNETRPKDQAPAAQAEPQAFRQLDSRKRDAPADQDKKLNVEAARDDRLQLRDAAVPKEEKAVAQTPPPPTAPMRPPAAPAAVALEAPAAAPTRTEDFAAGARMAELSKTAKVASPIEIATLDPSLGWRVAGDRIERSTDGGKTWTLVRRAPDGIVAGSAPSNTVCWFVGRAGRVLLTVNAGADFADVSLPESLDLASVAAIDARTAMVYSVVGRRFRTEDGGRTWRQF